MILKKRIKRKMKIRNSNLKNKRIMTKKDRLRMILINRWITRKKRKRTNKINRNKKKRLKKLNMMKKLKLMINLRNWKIIKMKTVKTRKICL